VAAIDTQTQACHNTDITTQEHTMRRRYQTVCHCSSYGFPHRMSGGACQATSDQELCQACGQPDSGKSMDFGVGWHEYWGHVSFHSDVQWVSTCCEAELRDNRAQCLV
jgi:hypothetical protein